MQYGDGAVIAWVGFGLACFALGVACGMWMRGRK